MEDYQTVLALQMQVNILIGGSNYLNRLFLLAYVSS